jgi:hypothetical protein
MSEMIERVAAAIGEANTKTEGLKYSDLLREMARASLRALREPTDAMEEVGDATFQWTSSDTNGSWYPQKADATECWQAMIDAVLVDNSTDS